MNIWLRRTVGVLTLGGSSVGVAAILSQISISQLHGLNFVFIAVFFAVFIFGIAVGALLIENTDNSVPLALPFWLIQVPILKTAWISYGFYTGAKFDIVLESDLTISYVLSGGANFSLYLFPADGTAVGVNVVAIVMGYLLWKHRGGVM